jgi:quercetin 2,3-dioxygenase
MITKLSAHLKQGNSHIAVLYPGAFLQNSTDTGFYTIGRIDQANIKPGITIKMHPHSNDEILSYFRTGKVRHTDSGGFTEYLQGTKLMLMKAGEVFYHEEEMIDIGENMEGLQIFMRPKIKNDKPSVTFLELPQKHSENNWRCIANPTGNNALALSTNSYIFDVLLYNNSALALPATSIENPSYLLYNFMGESQINNINLQKGDACIITNNEAIAINTNNNAELVLFVVDTNEHCFTSGVFSGNQNRLQ